MYTDNSLEFGKSCEDLTWSHRTSTPHRSETKGIAERAVRRVKEGTSAVLLQSGLDEKWWADSMECYCYLRTIEDLLAGGKTLYERRLGEPKGQEFLLEQWLNIIRFLQKDQLRLPQFGKKVLPGIFLGYELVAGGIWNGDIPVADLEDLEKLDASEIYPRRINAKEVLITPKEDEFIFPEADGTAKLSRRDYKFREPHSKAGTDRKESRFQQRTSR